MTRILLLENKTLSLHNLRIESRRCGLSFLYEGAATPADFLRLLSMPPAMIVSTVSGLHGMPLGALAECAGQAGVPLFLVGGDTREERAALAALGGQVCGSCRRTRVPWLPMLLERALRESGFAAYRAAQVAVGAPLHLASQQMRQVQKLAIIGRLTGSVVHEINNPLESITNLIYLLSVEAQMPEHLRQYVEMAGHELKRVTEITRQTLSFHRETKTPIRVELTSLLEEVLALYARRLSEKRIKVIRRYESEKPVLLFPGEMRQVYANLLSNAIEATEPEGRIVVRVRRACRTEKQGVVEGVRVVVADNGSGIAPQALLNLGRPFFTTKGQHGTGLGLWVSQAIIGRYNGDIQLRSSIASGYHGTIFRIFLPLNQGPQVEAEGAGMRADVEPSSGGLRISAGSQ